MLWIFAMHMEVSNELTCPFEIYTVSLRMHFNKKVKLIVRAAEASLTDTLQANNIQT